MLIDRAQHLALPWITLMVVSIAGLQPLHARVDAGGDQLRLRQDGEGEGPDRAAGRNEARFPKRPHPPATLVALNFGTLLGGAVVTETIFALDVMGRYFINALGAGDPYLIMAWLMITAVMIIIGNLLADILYGYLDPRIRYD